jgi:serine/threonine-protein kinase
LFGAETVAKSKDAVRSRYVEPPSIVRPEVATGFDEVVLRALSRDPRRRFQDLAEVSRALKRLLMSLPRAPAPEDVAEWLRHVFAPERIALKIQIAQGNAVEGALARLRLLGDPAGGEMGPRGGPPSGTPPVVSGVSTLPPPSGGASHAVPTPQATRAVTKARAEGEVPTTSGGGGAKAAPPGPVQGTSARPPIAIIGAGAAILGVIAAVLLFRPTSPERTGEGSVAALGALQIDSTPPGAQVLIDGDPSGRATPARITGLRAGRKVDIQVDMPGYRSTKQTVQVPVGGPTALRFVLEESTGTVRLEGVPHGAKTYVDDAPVNAAEPISLSIGTHRLRVEVSGELFTSTKVDVKRGKQVLRVQAAEGTGK